MRHHISRRYFGPRRVMFHAGITLVLLSWLQLAGTAAAQSVSDSDFMRIEPPVKVVTVDSTGEKFHMAVMIDNRTVLGAIALPLSFPGLSTLKIDTTVMTPPDIRGVTYGRAGRSSAWTIKTSLPINNLKQILAGFISFSAFPATDDTLCYVHFDLVPGGGGALVRLDSARVSGQSLVVTSVLAIDYTPTWMPGFIQIDYSLGGDMACDGKVTVGDIVYLVNYLFKNGPEPCIPGAADVDCDGSLTLSDAIWLINYLFRGGLPPSSPCD